MALTVENDRDVQQFKKRLAELSETAYRQNRYTYTGFLSLAEQDIFYCICKNFSDSGFLLFGGNKDCERKMLRFGTPETLGYEEEYPIRCLNVAPVAEKFADELGHRDYLGALMNLGVERNHVGDIFIRGKQAFVFCTEKMADYLSENLDKVRHTNVRCKVTKGEEDLPVSEPKRIGFTVASQRIDGVAAKVFSLSRSECQNLLKAGKLYLNGRLCENGSYILKDNDHVTIRGYGKFVFYGFDHETKKGRFSVNAGVYQ